MNTNKDNQHSPQKKNIFVFTRLLFLLFIFGIQFACTEQNNDEKTPQTLSITSPNKDRPKPLRTSRPSPILNLERALSRVSASPYQKDLEFIAAPRPSGSPHWQAVQDLCAERFERLGYQVERQNYGSGVNVIGTRKGSTLPDEIILLSAHYDHIEGCAGADDNASGVAGLLEAARIITSIPTARTLVLACWDEEEHHLDGSKAYATRAKDQGEKIQMAYVFEMIGYRDNTPGSQSLPEGFSKVFPKEVSKITTNGSRGDSLVVISDAPARRAAQLIRQAGEKIGLPIIVFEASDALKASPAARDLRRSDHASFWSQGFPSLMVTDTANFRNPHYHCREGEDLPITLDHDYAVASIRVVLSALLQELNAPPNTKN